MGKKGFRLSVLIFCVSIGLFGLFYEYAGCMAGAACALLLCVSVWFRRKLYFYVNADSLLFCVWIASYGVVSFYAVDQGTAFLGFLKILSVFFFTGLAMQMDEKQRKFLLKIVPLSACLMVILGLAGYWIAPLYGFLFKAGRLGGSFQYANVFALFCLAGIILEAEEERHYRHDIQMGILSLGIALSGSRTVFLLAVAVFLLLAVKEKRHRIPFLAAAVLLVGGMGIYVLVSKDVENIGRIYSSLISSSSLRRVLYLKDGLRLALHHPFGLGYLGWYFMQPAVQTGVYSARFVHSGLLQIALDVGIVPCLAFAAVFVRSFFSKRAGFYQKLVIAVIGLHSLADFDLEFTVILFVLVLSLDFYHGREVILSTGGKLAVCKISGLCLASIMLYCGAAMAFHTFGKPETAIRMLPIYSESKTVVLQNEEDMQRAQKLAEDLAGRNDYIAAPHDILALAAYENGDYRTMAAEKEKSVDLQKYNIEAYNRYVILLSRGIGAAYAQGDEETLRELFIRVAEVPDKLEKVREETDPLAYQIKRKPKFKLDEEVQEYIDSIRPAVKAGEDAAS